MLAAGLALVLVAAPGCVRKKTYRGDMEELDGRVVGVESAVEANQRRISDIEQQTNQKLTRLEGETQSASKTGKEALTTAQAAEKAARGKLLWEVTMSDDALKFEFGQAQLSDTGMAALEDLVAQLKAKGRELYMEVEGHTDSVGEEVLNERLGEQRAEAVRAFLNEQGGIPLHAINTISYGESKPVADNSTKEGRAQNRRVVIRVLE
jgi:outer membrane protein OmpA-like peptidoglycan-associated protein